MLNDAFTLLFCLTSNLKSDVGPAIKTKVCPSCKFGPFWPGPDCTVPTNNLHQMDKLAPGSDHRGGDGGRGAALSARDSRTLLDIPEVKDALMSPWVPAIWSGPTYLLPSHQQQTVSSHCQTLWGQHH